MELENEYENIPMGILGALLGGLIGGVAIVVIGQMGLISAISGLLLAFCTLKGYALLSKNLNNTGIFISIGVMLIVPYFADRVSWALVLMEELGWLFGDAFLYVHDVVEEYGLQSEYWKELLFVYAFTAAGAFACIKNILKQRNAKTAL